MEISLEPELEKFIQSKIRDGQYKSVNEAINALLKTLMERELIYQGRSGRTQTRDFSWYLRLKSRFSQRS